MRALTILAGHEREEEIDANKINWFFTKWMRIIQESIEECTPKKKYKLITSYKESDLLKEIIRKFNEMRNTRIWTREIIREVRILQDLIIEESKRLTNDRWNELMSNVKGIYKHPSEFWNEVKRLKGSSKEPPTYLINENTNEKIHDQDEQLNMFKRYYEGVYVISDEENRNFNMNHERNIMREMQNNQERYQSYTNVDLSRLDPEDPFTRPVTKNTIINAIKTFKNKAPGTSGINKIMLINLPEIAYEIYALITNWTISMGYFPLIFKEGIIVLILKPYKNPRMLANYRPITLLEVPGKILERIINDRFMAYQEMNEKFHQNQFGFRKNKGTDIAIAKIYETVALNQRDRRKCNIVCRDIQKAFDKVWHNGLRYKIVKLELPTVIEKILISFTRDRSAKIKYRNKISDRIMLRSGVPQGSIISPSLFIAYTSDLPQAGPGTTDICFADDVSQVIEYNHGSRKMLAARTQREIARINEYEERWKIKTSQNKFKILSISAAAPEKVKVNNVEIPFSNEASILGLTLTRSGVNRHIRKMAKKAKDELAKLKRFKTLTPKIKIHLYEALVQPLLEYPIVPICGMSKTNQLKLQRIQNKAIKLAKSNDPEELSVEDAHIKYKVDAYNVRLYKRRMKIWDKLARSEQQLVERSLQENNNATKRDHGWWHRIGSLVMNDEPEPIYT